MTERSKKIMAGIYRRAKIFHAFATIITICGGIMMLGVVYTFPKEPQVWLGLSVFATCIWYFLAEWNDVMHPERHSIEHSQATGQAGG